MHPHRVLCRTAQALALLACTTCEPPQFEFSERPTTADLAGTWQLDHRDARWRRPDGSSVFASAGVETLSIAADGTYVQTFARPGGFDYRSEQHAWSVVELPHGGPRLRMSGMVCFADVASGAGGLPAPADRDLVLRPTSAVPWGRPDGWILCLAVLDLEPWFTKTP
jgi:hypothetical protein